MIVGPSDNSESFASKFNHKFYHNHTILTSFKIQNGDGCSSRHFGNCPTFYLFVNIFISGAKTKTNFIPIKIRTAWNPLQMRNNWNTSGKTSCNHNSNHCNLHCNCITLNRSSAYAAPTLFPIFYLSVMLEFKILPILKNL